MDGVSPFRNSRDKIRSTIEAQIISTLNIREKQIYIQVKRLENYSNLINNLI